MFFHYFLGIRPGFDHGQFINGLGINPIRDRSCQQRWFTGPMPRKPKATRPKAKTGAANLKAVGMIFHDGRRLDTR